MGTVSRQLEIRGCDGLVDLTGLEQVTQAASLELVGNPTLLDLATLDNLESVAGDFKIAGNTELASLAGLAGLVEVGGNFEIIDNDALVDLQDMGAPEFPMAVGGHVQICENGSLVELADAMSVMATAADVSVIRNH